MKNVFIAFIDYFDDMNDFYHAAVGLFSFTILAASPLMLYLDENIAHYGMLAVLSIIGQTAMYFAKFRFPNYFGTHEDRSTVGTKILYYLVDCFLASIFGILGHEYIATWIFGATNIKQTVLTVVLIGAFYETLLKKLLKKVNDFSKDEEADDLKKKVVLDGQDSENGTPVPIKRPPNEG